MSLSHAFLLSTPRGSGNSPDHLADMRHVFLFRCSILIEMGQGKGGRALTHLVVSVRVLVRVLAQNFHDALPALDPDPRACLAALRIVEPGLEFVRGHVYLLVEERDHLCIGFGHSEMKERTDGW